VVAQADSISAIAAMLIILAEARAETLIFAVPYSRGPAAFKRYSSNAAEVPRRNGMPRATGAGKLLDRI
jgi:hypothetical protein